jgi:aminoglycoside phosphotransferase (APT) family kinase protein
MKPIPGRLRAFGAACAAINSIPAPAEPRLPHRIRPISGVDFAAVRRARGTKGLVADAEQAVAELPVPDAERVFVHGDLWQGNTLWVGDELSALVDWDCSGVGSYGVDLGSARCDAAVMYGPEFAADVLAGWQEGSGRAAEDVAYWDVVAALSTPPAMAEFVPPIQGQGRTDLDQPILAERRDAFLRAALDKLA